MSSEIKRSISLYSYQDEYYDGKLDLEGCLKEVAKQVLQVSNFYQSRW